MELVSVTQKEKNRRIEEGNTPWGQSKMIYYIHRNSITKLRSNHKFHNIFLCVQAPKQKECDTEHCGTVQTYLNSERFNKKFQQPWNLCHSLIYFILFTLIFSQDLMVSWVLGSLIFITWLCSTYKTFYPNMRKDTLNCGRKKTTTKPRTLETLCLTDYLL